MKKIISLFVGTLLLTVMTVTGANSAQTLKCQTVISAKADEVIMLKDFTDTVTELTQGSLKFEIMPTGSVVGVKETLDAVDKGRCPLGIARFWILEIFPDLLKRNMFQYCSVSPNPHQMGPIQFGSTYRFRRIPLRVLDIDGLLPRKQFPVA